MQDQIRAEVLKFIDLFYPAEQKEVGAIHELIYTQGQCFRFAQMLHTAFKQYNPVIVGTGLVTPTTQLNDILKEIKNCTYNHYYCKIGSECFDITGVRDFRYDDYELILVQMWRNEPSLTPFEGCLDENNQFKDYWRCIYELTDEDVIKVESQLKEQYHKSDMRKWIQSVLAGFEDGDPTKRFLTATWLKHREGPVGNYKFTGLLPDAIVQVGEPVMVDGILCCDGGIAEDIFN